MKISVIIPAYNHDKYIGATIRSVLDQTYQDFELIIINDGSMDNTEDEILKFDDPRIHYISQKNSGAHHTINRGIELSNGYYLSILNSDDIYNATRLEKCINFLEDRKDYSVVITEVEAINGEGVPASDMHTPHFKAWRDWYREALRYCHGVDFLLCALAKNILITTSNYFVRKEVFQKVGGFRRLRYAHDWDMLLRLSQQFNVHLIKEALLQYRIHESNTVHEASSEDRVRFEVNWLIADTIRTLKNDANAFDIVDSIKKNHYINFKLLSLLLMIDDNDKREDLLDFDSDMTLEAMKLLK